MHALRLLSRRIPGARRRNITAVITFVVRTRRLTIDGLDVDEEDIEEDYVDEEKDDEEDYVDGDLIALIAYLAGDLPHRPQNFLSSLLRAGQDPVYDAALEPAPQKGAVEQE